MRAFASTAGPKQRVAVGQVTDAKKDEAIDLANAAPGRSSSTLNPSVSIRSARPPRTSSATHASSRRKSSPRRQGTGYRPGDRTGATGLELSQDAVLAGKPGGMLGSSRPTRQPRTRRSHPRVRSRAGRPHHARREHAARRRRPSRQPSRGGRRDRSAHRTASSRSTRPRRSTPTPSSATTPPRSTRLPRRRTARSPTARRAASTPPAPRSSSSPEPPASSTVDSRRATRSTAVPSGPASTRPVTTGRAPRACSRSPRASCAPATRSSTRSA